MGPKSIPINTLSQSRLSDGSTKSFRSGPQASYRTPYLSAPVGHILAEVRAPQPFRGPQPLFPPNKGEHGRDKSPNKSRSFSQVRRTSAPVSITNTKGGTMTRGHNGGMYSRMDTLTWLNSVKVGERREGSSETGSGVESGNVSRKGSKSRRNSKSDYHERTGLLRRSESRARGEDEAKENDLGQPSLQDEYALTISSPVVLIECTCRITSVMTKLSSYKIKLEKVNCLFTSVRWRELNGFVARPYQKTNHRGWPTWPLGRNLLSLFPRQVHLPQRLSAGPTSPWHANR